MTDQVNFDLDKLERLARDGATDRLQAAVVQARMLIEQGRFMQGEEAAFRLIDILAIAGLPEEAADIAERFWRLDHRWTYLDRTFAHALIERGRYGAAQLLLERLETMPDLSAFEAASCQAHFGRLFKSQADAIGPSQGADAAAAARKEAVARYSRALELSRGWSESEADARGLARTLYRVWRWSSTNLLTLLEQSKVDHSRMREIADDVTLRIGGRADKDYFDHSALGAAYLTLGRIEDGVAEYEAMLDQPEISLGQIDRVLRDFKGHRRELVERHDTVALVRLALEAARLRRLKGVVVVSSSDRARLLERYHPLLPGDEAKLSPHVFAVSWLAQGIREAAAVARIFNKGSAHEQGSGFVISGDRVGLASEQRVLITCAHVLSRDGLDGSIKACDAVVRFEGGREGTELSYKVAELIFESSPTDGLRLDAAIAILSGDTANIPMLGVGAADVVRAAARDRDLSGGYTIGHPLSRELSITLGPARFTEHYTDLSSHRDALFLRYTTETAPGNSGGPIFDRDWNAVALHQQGYTERSEQAGRGLILTSLLEIAMRKIGG